MGALAGLFELRAELRLLRDLLGKSSPHAPGLSAHHGKESLEKPPPPLLALSLIPFVTGWMGENHFATLPVAFYGVGGIWQP